MCVYTNKCAHTRAHILYVNKCFWKDAVMWVIIWPSLHRACNLLVSVVPPLSLLHRGATIIKEAQISKGSVNGRAKVGFLLGPCRRKRKWEDYSWAVWCHHCATTSTNPAAIGKLLQPQHRNQKEINCLCPGGQLFQVTKKKPTHSRTDSCEGTQPRLTQGRNYTCRGKPSTCQSPLTSLCIVSKQHLKEGVGKEKRG